MLKQHKVCFYMRVMVFLSCLEIKEEVKSSKQRLDDLCVFGMSNGSKGCSLYWHWLEQCIVSRLLHYLAWLNHIRNAREENGVCHTLADTHIVASAYLPLFGGVPGSYENCGKFADFTDKWTFISWKEKATFRGDDLCCVSVLDDCSGPP